MKKKETDQKRGSEEKRRAKVWWKARIVVLVMICTGLIQWPERMDTGVNGVCVFAQPVSGETTEADAVRQADSEGSASIDNSQEKQLTDQLELTDLQSMVDEMLGENSFSVTEAFHRLLSGEEVLSEESVREFLHSLLFSSLEKEKSLIVKLLLLLLFAAVFSGFAGAFDNGQIGEISFYVVYLLVFTLLMNSFSGLSASLLSILRWITEFMKELSPVYFMAVAAASGASTAAVFYQGVLLLSQNLHKTQMVQLEDLCPDCGFPDDDPVTGDHGYLGIPVKRCHRFLNGIMSSLADLHSNCLFPGKNDTSGIHSMRRNRCHDHHTGTRGNHRSSCRQAVAGGTGWRGDDDSIRIVGIHI